MLYNYAVRITHDFATARPVIHSWATRCTKILVYQHLGKKTKKAHIHILMEGVSLQKKQLRNIGSATGVNLTGNELCSFKEYDGDTTYITYMTEGENDPLYNVGYDINSLTELKAKYVKHEHQKVDKPEDVFLKYFLDYENMSIARDMFWKDKEDDKDPNREWRFLKHYAKDEVFGACGNKWNKKAFDLYKTAVYTAVFRLNITIPDTEKDWKRYL